MGLVGVRVEPGGEQRLGARRTEADHAVAALVQLYGLLDEQAPLAAALRAAADGVDQQRLVAVSRPGCLSLFSGSTVKNVPTARPMTSPAATAPAQPCRR